MGQVTVVLVLTLTDEVELEGEEATVRDEEEMVFHRWEISRKSTNDAEIDK